jgi:hypothetical protein
VYTSALVPRGMAVLGLIGGPLIIASGVGVMFGVIEAEVVMKGIATIPVFLWELSLGISPIAHRQGIQSICGRSPTARITVGELSDGIRHARRSPGVRSGDHG